MKTISNLITITILLIAVALVATGCSTLSDSPDTWPPYQKDINFREVWE